MVDNIHILTLTVKKNDYLSFFLNSYKDCSISLEQPSIIRQFAKVVRQWYQQSPYPKVKQWLSFYMQSVMFTKVMAKHALWLRKG
jgi:hypothetical protein